MWKYWEEDWQSILVERYQREAMAILQSRFARDRQLYVTGGELSVNVAKPEHSPSQENLLLLLL